jgi:2-dehydro-3-deoxygalactonokinase
VTSKTEWVAVDWGTSNVRAWGIAADGGHTFSAQSDRGMGKIARADYPSVLDELIADKVPPGTDTVVCGMAGARQGWLEAPYLDTPADLNALARGAVRPEGTAFAARILPGICQRAGGHEDVMRGEETQLLGLLAQEPGFEGTAILPGTHSKWVEISGGRIVRFSTAMTGELYEVLSQHSVLRHSFAAGTIDGPEIEDGIAEGMRAGLESPALATSLVFRTRAAALLSGKGADWCSGYLSGLLVGVEIGGHRDWLGTRAVPLIGSARFGRLYGAALKLIGVTGTPIDASDATIAGLIAARAQTAVGRTSPLGIVRTERKEAQT